MNTNTTKNTTGLVFDFPFSNVTQKILLYSWIVIFVLGTVGNVLVIVIILKVKFLRTRLNMMIVNLAGLDLMFNMFHCPVLIVTFAHGAYPVSEDICRGLLGLVRFIVMGESCNITLIALSRYFNVCRKRTFDKYFTKHGTAYMCLGIWVVGFLVNVNVIINPESVIFNKAWQVCFVDDVKSMGSKYIFFAVLVPQYFVTFYLYLMILKEIGKTQNAMYSHRNNMFKNLNNETNRSQILSSFVIFSLYLILPMPFLVQIVFNPNTPDVVQAVMLLLLGLNNSINCIVYGLLNKNVIRYYKQVLPVVWFTRGRDTNNDVTITSIVN